jgi:hypothetical protein
MYFTGEFLALVKHKYMHVVSLCGPSKSCFSYYTYNEKYTMFLILHGHMFLMKVFKKFLVFMCNDTVCFQYICTVKPVLNGISREQNFFPLKPVFCLIKVHYI